ncbi:MAG: hypothetical protein AB4058_15580 [Microcystaceae cyanobacterium]
MSFFKRVIQHQNTIAAFSSLLTSLSIVLGGCYTIFQYQSHQQEKRVNRVVAYSDKFYQQKLSKSLTKINDQYYEQIEDINKILGQENYLEEYHNFVIKFTKENQEEVEIIGDFFEKLASCVASNLCDQETALKLFGSQGKDYFVRFYPYYCQKQQKWQDPRIGTLFEEVYYDNKKEGTCNYMSDTLSVASKP